MNIINKKVRVAPYIPKLSELEFVLETQKERNKSSQNVIYLIELEFWA